MGCVQPLSYPVRVVVADSSPINALLLSEAIGKDRNISVAAFTADPREITPLVLEYQPHVLLLSATLDEKPNRGFEAISELKVNCGGPKVVMLLDSSKPETVVKSFCAGARGVFCRTSPIKSLCKCIQVVQSGQIWANTQELGFLVNALSASNVPHQVDANRFALLSEREQDVVGALAQGLSNREIAHLLSISPHTVKNYMFRIFEKLGVSSRVELLFYVMSRNGTISQKEQFSISEQSVPFKTNIVAIPPNHSTGAPNKRVGQQFVLEPSKLQQVGSGHRN
ncbi:MAG: response regulator transcription factor [Terriglobales bacterium]